MEDRALEKIIKMTDKMYTSIMGQMHNGYFAMWNPRFQELKMVMEALLSDYGRCVKGQVLQEQYEMFQACEQECNLLEEEVFVLGDLERMDELQKKFTACFQGVYEKLQAAICRYESIDEKLDEIIVLEDEYEKISEPLVKDYKLKIQNRIQNNLSKINQFDLFSKEEKTDFITHVILYDEGKLEKQILECLNEKERKVEATFVKLECSAIISNTDMNEEMCKEYVKKYRLKAGKKNPKEFSTSRQLMSNNELGTKFELWFDSLIGKESSVGKLIKEGSKAFDLPMEERMYEAIEGVIDSNLGALNMKEMIAAYKEECLALKEQSFEEFYGIYEEVQTLMEIVAKAHQIFPKWSVKDVSIANIILGEY